MMILAAESIARGTITKSQHLNQISEFSINCYDFSDTTSARAQIVESIIFLDPCPLISRRHIPISSPLVDYSMILGNQQLKSAYHLMIYATMLISLITKALAPIMLAMILLYYIQHSPS